jgi:nonribosomal peptide synthetase DhbF
MARPLGHIDPLYLTSLISTEEVTIIHFVPSMLRPFLDVAPFEQCASLRAVMCSGEALSPAVVHEFAGRLPSRLNNLYGPTEASVDVTYWECSAGPETVPIGRPIWNTRVYVLDAELQAVPIGVSGELYLGGVGLARGYLGRAGLTGERFIPDPFGSGDRLYRSGDLGRWRSDGELEHLGRIDHQVKLRGYRIELGEIEAALRNQPSITDAVVVAREDAPGDKRLVAYVVSKSGKAPESSELRAHLTKSLPEYMVPSAFVVLDALPLTPNGKVDRKALPAADAQPNVTEYVAPRTSTEQLLVEIWQDLLKLERIGIHDNFFALGGHSLLATRVMARLRERVKLELPLRALFRAPTVGALGERIDNLRWAAQSLSKEEIGTTKEDELEDGIL